MGKRPFFPTTSDDWFNLNDRENCKAIPPDFEAVENYYPGYAQTFTKIGRERGWPPVTRTHFDELVSPLGALVVGNSEEVAAKILRHSEALGGISRFTFQMDNAKLSHTQLMEAIELIGTRVMPLVSAGLE